MALWFCWFVSLLGCAALEVMWGTLYEVWGWIMLYFARFGRVLGFIFGVLEAIFAALSGSWEPF